MGLQDDTRLSQRIAESFFHGQAHNAKLNASTQRIGQLVSERLQRRTPSSAGHKPLQNCTTAVLPTSCARPVPAELSSTQQACGAALKMQAARFKHPHPPSTTQSMCQAPATGSDATSGTSRLLRNRDLALTLPRCRGRLLLDVLLDARKHRRWLLTDACLHV